MEQTYAWMQHLCFQHTFRSSTSLSESAPPPTAFTPPSPLPGPLVLST